MRIRPGDAPISGGPFLNSKRRSFTLRDAMLLALLLHAAPLLFDWLTEGRLTRALMTAEAAVPEDPEKPMAFRFVDLPREREPEAPENPQFYSDRARRAHAPEISTPRPIEQPRMQGRSETEMSLPSPPSPRRSYTPPPSPGGNPAAQPRREESSRQAQREREPAGETQPSAAEFLRALQKAAQASAEKAAPSDSPAPESPGALDKFFQTLAAQGFRNPDGSVSAIGEPTFDTADFDFGPYARRLYWKVRSNWHPSAMTQYLGRTWVTQIEFDILKDGTVENPRVVKESGVPSYDREALYSILSSYPLEALPEGYAHDRVSVRFHYYYHIYY
jgi:outer membrane biosynthesis protein TonB